VIAAANEDIITAETTFSSTGNPQLHVVRADANGNVAAGWHRLYDLNTARLLAGRTVYQTSGEHPAGATSELIGTTGRANGTYIAKTTGNGTPTTTRIVVER
jgi:hypothetical protein